MSEPGQGLPVRAACTQMTTVALGPESVKSAKKLSGSFGNAVSPFLTVLSVTIGNGIVMFDLACFFARIARASSSETSDRNGGWPTEMPCVDLPL